MAENFEGNSGRANIMLLPVLSLVGGLVRARTSDWPVLAEKDIGLA